jgi:hypothetical protein
MLVHIRMGFYDGMAAWVVALRACMRLSMHSVSVVRGTLPKITHSHTVG